APPVAEEARDSSEETKSNDAVPRRQCDYVSEGKEKGGMLMGRNREYHEALQASETTMFLTVPPNSAPLARLTLHRQIPLCRHPTVFREDSKKTAQTRPITSCAENTDFGIQRVSPTSG
ncbi:MAG: hypothetical protein IJK98_00035, partial [Clostridia bacterium]|nr:hypothetical protein [Clostridia bacterium]